MAILSIFYTKCMCVREASLNPTGGGDFLFHDCAKSPTTPQIFRTQYLTPQIFRIKSLTPMQVDPALLLYDVIFQHGSCIPDVIMERDIFIKIHNTYDFCQSFYVPIPRRSTSVICMCYSKSLHV